MYVNAAMYLEVFQTSFIFHGISRSALDDLSSGNSFAYDYSTYGQRLQRPHLTSSSSPSEIGGRKGATSFVYRASCMTIVLTILSSFGARLDAQPFE